MTSGRFTSRLIEIPFEDIESFGPTSTEEEMVAQFDSIVSAEDWACRYGIKLGHTKEEWLAVVKMLRLGTARWRFPEMQLPEHAETFPTATTTTWWIFAYSEQVGDEGLYKRLFSLIKQHHFDPESPEAEAKAMFLLKFVATDIEEWNMHIMAKFFERKGAGKGAAKDHAASNAAPNAEGESKGKGKHSRKP